MQYSSVGWLVTHHAFPFPRHWRLSFAERAGPGNDDTAKVSTDDARPIWLFSTDDARPIWL